MTMNGTVDGCFSLCALPLLLEKCFARTIKAENWLFVLIREESANFVITEAINNQTGFFYLTTKPKNKTKLFLLTLFIMPYGVYFSVDIYYLLFKRYKESKEMFSEKIRGRRGRAAERNWPNLAYYHNGKSYGEELFRILLNK